MADLDLSKFSRRKQPQESKTLTEMKKRQQAILAEQKRNTDLQKQAVDTAETVSGGVQDLVRTTDEIKSLSGQQIEVSLDQAVLQEKLVDVQEQQLAASELLLDVAQDISDQISNQISNQTTGSGKNQPIEQPVEAQSIYSTQLSRYGLVTAETLYDLMVRAQDSQPDANFLDDLKETHDWLQKIEKNTQPERPGTDYQRPQVLTPKPSKIPEATPELSKSFFSNDKKIVQLLEGIKDRTSSTAGSLATLATGLTAGFLKMTALLTLGLIAAISIEKILRQFWEDYGKQITEFIGQFIDGMKAGWEEIKKTFVSLGLDKVWNSVKDLLSDIIDGRFLHGYGKYLMNVGAVIADNLRMIGESVVRALPGGEKFADKMELIRLESKFESGKITDKEIDRLKELNTKYRDEKTVSEMNSKREIDRSIAIQNQMRAEGIEPVRNKKGIIGKDVDRTLTVMNEDYRRIEKEVLSKNPELAPVKTTTLDTDALKAQRAVNLLADVVSDADSENLSRGDRNAIERSMEEINKFTLTEDQKRQVETLLNLVNYGQAKAAPAVKMDSETKQTSAAAETIRKPTPIVQQAPQHQQVAVQTINNRQETQLFMSNSHGPQAAVIY